MFQTSQSQTPVEHAVHGRAPRHPTCSVSCRHSAGSAASPAPTGSSTSAAPNGCASSWPGRGSVPGTASNWRSCSPRRQRKSGRRRRAGHPNRAGPAVRHAGHPAAPEPSLVPGWRRGTPGVAARSRTCRSPWFRSTSSRPVTAGTPTSSSPSRGRRVLQPFVRLAVARYQRDSLEPAAASPPWSFRPGAAAAGPARRPRPLRRARSVISVNGSSPTRSTGSRRSWRPAVRASIRGREPGDRQIVDGRPVAEPGVPAGGRSPARSVVRERRRDDPAVDTGGDARPAAGSSPRDREPAAGSGSGAPQDLLRRNVFVDTIILPAAWRPA